MERDPHPWRAALVLGLAFAALVPLASMVLFPIMFGTRYWKIPYDAWVSMQAAHFVTSGALPYVYESTRNFVALPGLPLVLAPIAWIGEQFHLTESVPFPLVHPTMWLVYAPYGALLGTPLLYAVRSVAFQLGVRRGLVRLQVLTLVFGLIPMSLYFGHYEDGLALAFLLLGLREVVRRKALTAAVLLGVAILFKQWALLGLPILAVMVPRGARIRFFLAGLALPAVFAGVALAMDWPYATQALFRPRSFLMMTWGGHRAFWVSQATHTFSGSPARLVLLLVATGVAWLLRRRMTHHLALFTTGALLLARFVFEPVAWQYYVSPGLVLLAAYALMTTGRLRVVALLGAALLGLFFVSSSVPTVAWWPLPLAACGALIAHGWRTGPWRQDPGADVVGRNRSLHCDAIAQPDLSRLGPQPAG